MSAMSKLPAKPKARCSVLGSLRPHHMHRDLLDGGLTVVFAVLLLRIHANLVKPESERVFHIRSDRRVVVPIAVLAVACEHHDVLNVGIVRVWCGLVLHPLDDPVQPEAHLLRIVFLLIEPVGTTLCFKEHLLCGNFLVVIVMLPEADAELVKPKTQLLAQLLLGQLASRLTNSVHRVSWSAERLDTWQSGEQHLQILEVDHGALLDEVEQLIPVAGTGTLGDDFARDLEVARKEPDRVHCGLDSRFCQN
mmetsp:Transcript_72189/g.163878  ORF Transcript_72189/g.163878 Transcript_72189/m.163878 type:complete len:250 (-) Transcript_72189:205-954(-)